MYCSMDSFIIIIILCYHSHHILSTDTEKSIHITLEWDGIKNAFR